MKRGFKMSAIDYIRVTDVLYPFSGLAKVPPEVLKNAALRGTKVHEICDALINHMGVFEIEENISGYIESFNQWFLNKKTIQKPLRFYCDDLGITGECDGIYKNETGWTLFDLKTPLKESKTWSLQGSAYAYLAKKSSYDITEIEFVKLSKDGSSPKIFKYDNNLGLFLKALELYKYFGLKNVNEEDYLQYI